MVGRLLFIARMWRPDVRFSVQRLCIKASKPTEQDQRAAYRIIANLPGSAQEGVTLNSWSHEGLDILTDVGEEVLEDKATSGILVMSGNSPVSWTSRKQDVTTLSSTEAEYIALFFFIFLKLITYMGSLRGYGTPAPIGLDSREQGG